MGGLHGESEIIFGQAFFKRLAEREAESRKKRRFLLITFLLRLVQSKEKWKAVKATLMGYRGTPTCVFPSFALGEIHPSWRLRTIGEFRPLRRATKALPLETASF